MKILLCLILTIILTNSLLAQVTPPLPYGPATKVNYVRTWEAIAPEQDPSILITRGLKDVRQTTVYLDGLGRTLQTVVKQGALTAGTAPADLVSPVVYDAFGREELKYLPFAANNTGGAVHNDGNFKLNPFQQQAAFLSTQFPGETYYYSRTQFEASPLNREEKIFPEGNSWVGAGRGVEEKNWFNKADDEVRIWSVIEGSGGQVSYQTSGVYAESTLFKKVLVDEKNQQSVEFKDKEGKIILVKRQIGATTDNGSGSGHAGWLCTYNIYDEIGNLRCIIQPQGVELIRSNWLLNDPVILSEQCFVYEYDERNRNTVKKIPGAGEVYQVYDSKDRLVFTQGANLKAKNLWKVNLYDQLNRIVLVGLINYNSSRQSLQELVTVQTTNNGSVSGVEPDLALNQLTFSGNYYASNSISLNPGFESDNNAAIEFFLVDPQGASDESVTIIEGVAVNRNPLPFGVSFELLQATYYDNYNWAANLDNNLKNFDITPINGYLFPGSGSFPYPQQVVKHTLVAGMVTGVKTRVIGQAESQFITIVKFYDENGRLIQERSKNVTQGYDVKTIQYSWSGKALVEVIQQNKAEGVANNHNIISKNDYDDLGRMKTMSIAVESTIGGKTFSKEAVEIANYEYNELGKVKKKILGEGIASLALDYNIRGWLLGINRDFVKDAASGYFGFELGYDKPNTIINGTNYLAAQFDGNVSGTVWKSIGDNIKRKFDYTYDAMDRLVSAEFNQYASGSFNRSEGVNFSLDNLTYDANGNILTMRQYGWKFGATNSIIDNLQYTYISKSNKLKNIIDLNNDPNTQLRDFRTSQLYIDALGGSKPATATDYTYDGNGNVLKDLNKNIGTSLQDGIQYNLLNLPEIITVQDANGVKGTIKYVYDADGNKYKKIVSVTGQPDKTTLYLGALIYENDSLQFLCHKEGRLRFGKHYFQNGDSAWEYNHDYFLKDHLNNTRMVITGQKDTTVYAATMETGFRTKETLLFSNITESAVATPVYYPEDINVTDPNQFVARVNGNSRKTGPSLLLKVMSGDQFKIAAKSFFNQQSARGDDQDPLEETLLTLANSIVGSVGAVKGSVEQLSNVNGPLGGALGLFRSDNNQANPTRPKAYLNWVLFDEQFRYVSASSGASPVTTPGQLELHNTDLNISKNGFLYVYVSNETKDWNVYFNDLIVQHQTGKILEETHYYPFGLAMAGISSVAANKLQNKKEKFQEQEFTTDLDVDLYEFKFRSHDPQTGRFLQIDPLSEKYLYNSVFAFSENKVTNHLEIEGLESAPVPYSNPWQPIALSGGEMMKALGKMVDRFIFSLSFSKSNIKKLSKVQNHTFSKETTTEYSASLSTDFTAWLGKVERTGTASTRDWLNWVSFGREKTTTYNLESNYTILGKSKDPSDSYTVTFNNSMTYNEDGSLKSVDFKSAVGFRTFNEIELSGKQKPGGDQSWSLQYSLKDPVSGSKAGLGVRYDDNGSSGSTINATSNFSLKTSSTKYQAKSLVGFKLN